MPGDVLFILGSASLVWLTLKVALRTREAPVPLEPGREGTTLETTLFTEVTPAGAAARA
jgi:hypothetical protein